MAVPTNLLQPQMASRGAKGSYEPENESVIKEFGKEMAHNINEIRLGLLPWKDPEWKLMVVAKGTLQCRKQTNNKYPRPKSLPFQRLMYKLS